MAIKKSELYSSLWASCDELRGGMDASQYKDYVLTMLFVKYISDKYKGDPYGAITVPENASFDDMVKLIGNAEIGDKINKQILNPIKEANKLNEFPDFNDDNRLGKGKDLVDTVSNLVRIFNDTSLDFSGNSAEGDDILGDAYEYLMRHFATESGKSKGQFYTPAEVSRVLAKVIGINQKNSSNQTKAYDPTCGSGSLLLKVMNEAGKNIDLYGQEKETTTANLAHMNMILHGAETATIVADNTLSRPSKFNSKEDGLPKFDYVVANPPFSLKSWSNGVSIENDEYNRFALGVPPEKNGDYAFLLHILQSMKANGKGAVVLPHGVLFRGNAEGEIRKNILKKGYIKAIIGLPANLFYGTGIPACIIVLDKENAENRKGLFMIDASKDFVKDGNKNRLREQDIRKITDVFDAFAEVPKFSRMVSMTEIADPKNDYNLNIPRYVDTQEAEDIQDLAGHLLGGIPEKDVDGLQAYWDLFPSLKADLFSPAREGYFELKVPAEDVKTTIFNHPEFVDFNRKMHDDFDKWLHEQQMKWNSLEKGFGIKESFEISTQTILDHFENNALVNRYSMYQHLMQYWNEVMQDDFYSISMDGWKAGNEYIRLVIKGKKGKDGKMAQDKDIPGLAGIEGRMITPEMMIHYFFKEENASLQDLENQLNLTQEALAEIEEENNEEEGVFSDLEKINLKNVKDFYKIRKAENASREELKYIKNYIDTQEALGGITKLIKIAKENLEIKVVAQYPLLTDAEIKDMVINHKWTLVLQNALNNEQGKLSQKLTQRIKELAGRYQQALPALETKTTEASRKVMAHLQKMGLVW
ncbi:type I restriction-modification system subunit M [Chryseobacterium sp. MYb328]|uniref:type I restriction-modification system subunit M n=1 Tax=Chryseobacterium sp. MYb328 TaxID=2745231 RepID=UPI00309FFBA9